MRGILKLRYPVIIFILLLMDITLVLWSCSDRNPVDPKGVAIPPATPDQKQESSLKPPVLPSVISDGRIVAGTGSLGFYKIIANSQTLKSETFEIRKAMNLGESHDVDITLFLQGNPCRDCFKISYLDYTLDEELIIGYSIRHPFNLPANDPPTSRERLDLHVFDLAGIIFLPDDEEQITNFANMTSYVSDDGGTSFLSTDNSGFWASEDYDGYTGNFDNFVDGFYETHANLHPYKILVVDPQRGNVNSGSMNGFDDIKNPSGHNVFAQGKTYSSELKFRIPTGESVEFIIALTACYGESAKGKGNMPGQRGNPRYFIPEFNRKEAWRARLSIPEETDLLESGDPMSTAILDLEIWDWQQSYGYPMESIDPLTSRLDALHHSSRVASCVIDIPSVNNPDIVTTPTSGNGFGETPLTYRITVNNDLGAEEGYYYGLAGIVDEMHGIQIEDYGVQRDGITTFDVSDFVTYIPFTVNVVNRGGESFSMSQTLKNAGDDLGYDAIIPDASDRHGLASYYDNVYGVYSALESDTGKGWDIYFKRSEDIGVTWSGAKRVNPNNVGNQRQGTIQVNNLTGEIFIAYVDESETLPESSGSDIVVTSSKDGGLTFSTPRILNSLRYGYQDQVSFRIDSFNTLYFAWRSYVPGSASLIHASYCRDDFSIMKELPIAQEVKTYYSNPVIGIRQSSFSSLNNNLYLAYKRSSYSKPDILCSRLLSFNTGYEIGMPASNEIIGDASNPSIAIDQNGVVFIGYIDNSIVPPAMKVARSSSAGKTWLHSRSLNESIGGVSPCNPTVVVRPSNNFVFLIWQDEVMGDRNIYIIRSTDGFTYCFPFKLNDDLTHLPQEYPGIISNQAGNLYAMWLDKRLNSIGEIYFTRGES